MTQLKEVVSRLIAICFLLAAFVSNICFCDDSCITAQLADGLASTGTMQSERFLSGDQAPSMHDACCSDCCRELPASLTQTRYQQFPDEVIADPGHAPLLVTVAPFHPAIASRPPFRGPPDKTTGKIVCIRKNSLLI